MEWNSLTKPIAQPAARPPTTIIWRPPFVPCQAFVLPLHPVTKQVFP